MTDTTQRDLDTLAQSHDMLLETQRRDGSWVPTPVNPLVERDHVFFRTWAESGKAKRLRNFADVRLAPSTPRGRRTGETLTGRARLLDGSESQRVASLMNHRYPVLQGVLVRTFHRLTGKHTQHYVVNDLRGTGPTTIG
jgi:PPOX class probable F420-dependent enzyme